MALENRNRKWTSNSVFFQRVFFGTLVPWVIIGLLQRVQELCKRKAMELEVSDLKTSRLCCWVDTVPSSLHCWVCSRLIREDHSPDRYFWRAPSCTGYPHANNSLSRWFTGLPVAALRCLGNEQWVVTRQMTTGVRTLGITNHKCELPLHSHLSKGHKTQQEDNKYQHL